MNEILVTVVGNVATDPTLRSTTTGARVATFRMASTERRFDRRLTEWRDGMTTFLTVSVWRAAAENVCSSVRKGQPVIVHGRLYESSYDDKDGNPRTSLELEAYAVGHDLSRGVATFTRATPVAVAVQDPARDADPERERPVGEAAMPAEMVAAAESSREATPA